jgi:regulator of protease activity HflC (stomatin/prohibitin superfamily)
MSLRSENLQGQTLKVNDKMGNPIEIGVVIVWKVGDTYKAAFEVERYTDFVKMQSEAAVRHLAMSFPYDNLEDDHAPTLREGGDKINQILSRNLQRGFQKREL